MSSLAERDVQTAARQSPAGCLDELAPDPDSAPICIRSAAATDAPLLGALIKALSPASRYRRFHTGVGELPAAVLEALVRFDPGTGIVLIATTRESGPEVAVGEARLVVGESGPETREFALAIADPLQRRGLGARLLQILIEYADWSGARRLYGDVLADNRPMLALAQRFGFVQRSHPSDRRLVRVQRDVHTLLPWSPREAADAEQGRRTRHLN